MLWVLVGMIGCEWLAEIPEEQVPVRPVQVQKNLRANTVSKEAGLHPEIRDSNPKEHSSDALDGIEERRYNPVHKPITVKETEGFQLRGADGEVIRVGHTKRSAAQEAYIQADIRHKKGIEMELKTHGEKVPR